MGEVAAPTRNLISVEEAQGLILEHVEPLPEELVSLREALGRVLAGPATAAVDLPPFDSSAMDGFALRSADTPGRLPVAHRIAAGSPAPRGLEAGEAMGIATGGVVPPGADAVIPLEYVVDNDNTIEIASRVEPGANVRPAGGDMHRGDVVVERGARLGAAQLAALAAAGRPQVAVARRPRAAVVATGSELRPPGEPLLPGQIYEANSILLEAQLASAGAERRAPDLGRRRRRSAPGGARPRTRGRRPGHLRRCVGRATRPRTGDPWASSESKRSSGASR